VWWCSSAVEVGCRESMHHSSLWLAGPAYCCPLKLRVFHHVASCCSRSLNRPCGTAASGESPACVQRSHAASPGSARGSLLVPLPRREAPSLGEVVFSIGRLACLPPVVNVTGHRCRCPVPTARSHFPRGHSLGERLVQRLQRRTLETSAEPIHYELRHTHLVRTGSPGTHARECVAIV
jgi:hypothetical protein